MSDTGGSRDISPDDPRLDWGPNEEDHELSVEQAERLQEREEPVAHADFGMALTGDLGRTDDAERAASAPETKEPDTSLGHEGGERYEEYAGDESEPS